ncbi:MAG: hypothetical protein AAFS10_09760 [Myxococcota bacterium]
MHYLPDRNFRQAVARYLNSEREAVAQENEALAALTPFRKAE